MFQSIEALARTEDKHSNAFRMKNYFFFYKIMKQQNFKSTIIQKNIELAEKIFLQCRHEYVYWIIHCKFSELFRFFDGIEELINLKSVEPEDVVNQFPKTTLRSILEPLQKTFEKSIENVSRKANKIVDFLEMKKRVDKHLGLRNESWGQPFSLEANSMNETWQYLEDYFMERYKRFEQIVAGHYSNMTLTPSSKTVVEILERVDDTYKSGIA